MMRFDFPALGRFRQRVLELEPGVVDTGWKDVLVPQGAGMAGRAWGDGELLEWQGRWVRWHVEAGVRSEERKGAGERGVLLTDYCGDWGFAMGAEGQDGVREVVERVCDYVWKEAPRLEDGVLPHGGWEYGRRSVWVDTLYYAAGVLMAGWRLTGRREYAEEAVRQCVLHAKHLRDERTGAFFHDVEPGTGVRTNWFWSRGNGWVLLALADTLRGCPGDVPERGRLLEMYRELATVWLRWQHACGLWRIVAEVEESHVETSGSAMLAAGLAIGVGEGWLEACVAGQVRRACQELVTWIDGKGALKGAQYAAGRGGWETLKLAPMGECTYATGLFLRLMGEVKKYQLS